MYKSRVQGGRQSSDTVTLPAPVGGWNARDSYTKMKVLDAITLLNFVPSTLYVQTRDGSTTHVTGLGAAIETLAVYAKTTGVQQLFGIAGGSMFDCTSAGAVGAAVVTGLSNNRFIYCNFSTAAGDYIYLVNGADKPILYTGSAYVRVDGTSTPAITGVTTTLLSYVTSYAQRLWFVEKASKRIWYLPVGSVGGAAVSIDLGNAFRKGGYIVAMGTITLDAGSGSDDQLAVISSEGEVAVYRGTDPSSASSWFRVGIYTIGRPIGIRPVALWAGDLLVLTEGGLGPLSQLVVSSDVNARANMLTDKIQFAISNAVALAGANYGWNILPWPQGNQLLLNVPLSSGIQQYGMNTITGAWCQITGWDAKSWVLFNGQPYFGTSAGKVIRAFYGETDDGAAIYTECLGAFSDYDNSSLYKAYQLARLSLTTSGVNASNSFDFATEVNYQTQGNFFTHTFPQSATGTAKWGTAVWGTDKFVLDNVPFFDWVQLVGGGYTMALHLRGYVNHPLQWRSYDVVYQTGGIL